jgi:hypothetical protein
MAERSHFTKDHEKGFYVCSIESMYSQGVGDYVFITKHKGEAERFRQALRNYAITIEKAEPDENGYWEYFARVNVLWCYGDCFEYRPLLAEEHFTGSGEWTLQELPELPDKPIRDREKHFGQRETLSARQRTVRRGFKSKASMR